jgi:hypothetical protein
LRGEDAWEEAHERDGNSSAGRVNRSINALSRQVDFAKLVCTKFFFFWSEDVGQWRWRAKDW